MINIVLFAHYKKKEAIIQFSIAYKELFANHQLHATGTTGTKIEEATGLSVHKFQSGPICGDQQIGALVATNEIDMIIFLRDPLTAQPHEPDVSELTRHCDVLLILLANNIAASIIIFK